MIRTNGDPPAPPPGPLDPDATRVHDAPSSSEIIILCIPLPPARARTTGNLIDPGTPNARRISPLSPVIRKTSPGGPDAAWNWRKNPASPPSNTAPDGENSTL